MLDSLLYNFNNKEKLIMVKCKMCGKMFDEGVVERYISSIIGHERYIEITNKYSGICDSCILSFHYLIADEDST